MNARRLLSALLVAGAGALLVAGPVAAQVAGPPAPSPTTAPPAGPPAPPPAPPAGPGQTPAPPGQAPGGLAPGTTVVPVPGGTITVTPTGQEPDNPAPEPEAPGEGTASLLRHPDLRGGQDPTLYEKYGTAGYSLDKDLGWRDVGDEFGNTAASVLWTTTTWIADTAITIFQWSYSLDLFGMTSGAINQVTTALSKVLYQPFVVPMIILAGLWLAWHALLKKRATTAAESSVWVVFALAAAIVFLAQPARIVGGLSGATTGLSRSILGGVASLDPKAGPDDGVTTHGTYTGNAAADSELRAAADRMWRTYVYAPWTVLEFGTTDKAPKWGERLLAAKALTAEEAAQIKNDPDAAERINADKQNQYGAIKNEIKKDPQAKAYFNGHRPGQRVAVAGLALVAVILSGGLIAALALATLFAQLALILLAMLGPVFLLAAIHPGAGRIIATRWANLLAYTAIKRVAYAVLLSVILVMNGALIDQGSKLGWAVAMTLSVALAGALLFYRKAFLSIIERVGTAGAGAAPGLTSAGDAAGRFSRRLTGAATLAGAAAIGGTGVGGTMLGWNATRHAFRRLTDLNTPRPPTTGTNGENSGGSGGTNGGSPTPSTPGGPSSTGRPRNPGVVLPDPERGPATKPLWRPYEPNPLPLAPSSAQSTPAPTSNDPAKAGRGGSDGSKSKEQRGRFPVKTVGVAWGAGRLNPNTLNPHRDAVADHFATPPPDPDPQR